MSLDRPLPPAGLSFPFCTMRGPEWQDPGPAASLCLSLWASGPAEWPQPAWPSLQTVGSPGPAGGPLHRPRKAEAADGWLPDLQPPPAALPEAEAQQTFSITAAAEFRRSRGPWVCALGLAPVSHLLSARAGQGPRSNLCA